MRTKSSLFLYNHFFKVGKCVVKITIIELFTINWDYLNVISSQCTFFPILWNFQNRKLKSRDVLTKPTVKTLLHQLPCYCCGNTLWPKVLLKPRLFWVYFPGGGYLPIIVGSIAECIKHSTWSRKLKDHNSCTVWSRAGELDIGPSYILSNPAPTTIPPRARLTFLQLP